MKALTYLLYIHSQRPNKQTSESHKELGQSCIFVSAICLPFSQLNVGVYDLVLRHYAKLEADTRPTEKRTATHVSTGSQWRHNELFSHSLCLKLFGHCILSFSNRVMRSLVALYFLKMFMKCVLFGHLITIQKIHFSITTLIINPFSHSYQFKRVIQNSYVIPNHYHTRHNVNKERCA